MVNALKLINIHLCSHQFEKNVFFMNILFDSNLKFALTIPDSNTNNNASTAAL